MKKIKRLFLVILSAIMVTASLVGCAGNDGASSGGTTTPPANKVTNPILTWNAFDSYADLWMFQTSRTFGDLSLNKNSDYILDGTGSGKATICAQDDVYLAGDIDTPSINTPTKKIPSYGVYTDDNSDFSMVTLVSFELYNPNNFDTQAAIQLYYDESTYSIPEYQVVKANSWTTITCPVQREFIPETAVNSYGDTAKKCEFIHLLFTRYEFEYVIYLENLCFYKDVTEVEEAPITLDEDEVCSFDKYWQYKKFSIHCYTNGINPTVEWIKDPAAPERGGMLRCTTADRSTSTSGSDWPSILLPSECFANRFNSSFATTYDDNDLFCVDVRLDNIGRVDRFYLEFYYGDVYFTTKTIICRPVDSGFEAEEAVNDLYYYLSDTDGDGWYSFKIPVSSLNKHVKTEYYVGPDGKEYAVDELKKTVSIEEGLATFNKLRFSYRSSPGYPSEVFYIDNFRMEKVD